jgi:Tfp pilus assembly protein PilN
MSTTPSPLPEQLLPPAAPDGADAPARHVLPATALRQLPRVDLLPPEIRERQRLRVLQRGLVASLVAAGVLVGGLHAVAAADQRDAQAQVDTQSAEAVHLALEKRQYASVPSVLAQAEAAEAELNAAMGQEVRWSLLLDDLDRRMPDGVWLNELTVTPQASAATAAPATPAAGAGATADAGAATSSAVATIAFTGTAVSQPVVATWLRVLSAVPGFSGAYLNSATSVPGAGSTPSTVTFNTSVTVTAAALSHRYLTHSGS